MRTIAISGMGRLAMAAAAMAGAAIEDVPRQRGPQRVETRPTYRKSAKLNRSRLCRDLRRSPRHVALV